MSGQQELPAEVLTIRDDIEKYSKKLEELLRTVEAIQQTGEADTDEVGSASGTNRGLAAAVLKQVQEHKAAMEARITQITTRLINLSHLHKDDLRVSEHIMRLYARLSQLVGGGIAELAIIAKRTTGEVDNLNTSIRTQMGALPEWGTAQLRILKETYAKSYQSLNPDTRAKIAAVHTDMSVALELVTTKLHEYANSKDVGEARDLIEQDLKRVAGRAQEAANVAAYHNYPVLGFAADGARQIMSDHSRSLLSRLVAVAWFIFCTVVSFLKTHFLRNHFACADDSASGMDS